MGSRAKMPSQKDLCVYLVEAGGLQVSGISDETFALVRKCIQDKIFSENQDDICIARADMTKNYEFGTVNWESLKKVESVFKKPKSKDVNPVSSLLAVCESMSLQAEEDAYARKKILFFSDLRTSVTEKELKTLKDKIEAENICLSIIVPNPESKSGAQECNVEIIRKILVGNQFVISTYKEACVQLANTCTKKPSRPSPWNIPLEIGDIQINVSGFVSIRSNKAPDISKAYLTEETKTINKQTTTTTKEGTTSSNRQSSELSRSKDIVETATTWKQYDGTILDEDVVGKAYYYGDKLVPFNELETEDSYSSGKQCLQLLVFCPKELIKPCYLIGDGITLFYPRDRNIDAVVQFDSLLKAMDKANRVAIVRKVYRTNSRPVIALLSPNMEKKCLSFMELCFAEDISIPVFPPLVKTLPSDDDGLTDKDQLIDDLISAKSLKSPFIPSEGPVDPHVKMFRDFVASKILGELTSEKKIPDVKCQLNNVDLYFENLVERNLHDDIIGQLASIFPVKVNVIEEERASGVNIFKKREIKTEENGDQAVKKPKLEETIKEEEKMEEDENAGLNADDLNSEDVPRILYAFDFDHTIVHENSDVAIVGIIDRPIPEELKKVYDGKNWTEYMDQVFAFLASEGVTIEDMRGFCQKMKFTPGMEELLKKIGEVRQASPNSTKLMVISDANQFFIEAFFEELGIKVDHIITNPSEITTEGRLRVFPFDNQISCKICPKNLCKGKSLLQYLSENGPFDQVIYTGDGRNDICPVMKLREQDTAFIRKGYAMDKLLQKGDINQQILAKTVLWESAKTIQDDMELN